MGGSKAVLGAARSLGGESRVACEDVVRHLNLNKLENIYNIGGRGGCVLLIEMRACSARERSAFERKSKKTRI